jgi:hypothetical protein
MDDSKNLLIFATSCAARWRKSFKHDLNDIGEQIDHKVGFIFQD